MGEQPQNVPLLAKEILLHYLFGIIQGIDNLEPSERTSGFLVKNLKASVEYRVALTKERDPLLAEQLETELERLVYEFFLTKMRRPLLVPPSALPDPGGLEE